MGFELKNTGKTKYSAQSCCGKIFNNVNMEILNAVYVDDTYVKKEAVSWLRNNIKKYKFVGFEAWKVKKEVLKTSDSDLNDAQTTLILTKFCKLLANNPFCAEAGIGIVQKSYILGKGLDGYFVKYKRDISIPIGCLELFVHSDIDKVLSEYLKNAKSFALEIVDNATVNAQNVEINLATENKGKTANSFRAFIAVTTFILAVIYVIYCLVNVNWKQLENIVDRSENLYHIIGFATEEGFGIGHNCSLNHILIGLGAFWLLHILLTNVKIVKELINAVNYKKVSNIKKVALSLEANLLKIKATVNQAYSFARENVASLNKIFIKRRCSAKKFGPKIELLSVNKNAVYDEKVRRVLPGTKWMFFLFVLMILTTAVGYMSTDTDFKKATRDALRDIEYNMATSALKAEHRFVITSESPVYAKGDESSLVLYNISANTKCDIVDEGSSELYSKISFLTEYGFLEGWISKELIAEYNPRDDETIERAMPNECVSSSELTGRKYYGPSNAADGRTDTSWQEGSEYDGVGEWIAYRYDEPQEISAFGIYNGNGGSDELYNANNRIIDVTVTFYCEDAEVGEVECTLQDGVLGMQYFDLNKTIYADNILLGINSVAEGYEYDDACVAELRYFRVKPQETE